MFATIVNGRENWAGSARVARHRHDQAYAAIVLRGRYDECGNRGRFAVGAGDVLLHRAYEAHLNRFATSGAEIVNLVLPKDCRPGRSHGRVRDADAIVRVAERDGAEAAALLFEMLTGYADRAADWPDELALNLVRDPRLRMDRWALSHRLAPATVSRGFRKVFGVTPARFRAEVRAQRALDLIVSSAEALSDIAVQAGFADQSHMTRSVRAVTQTSPGCLRGRSKRFKTAFAHRL